MKLFAELIDGLVHAGAPEAKVVLLATYFRLAPDPARGAAISLLLDEVRFPRLSPALARKLGAGRIDPVLFEMSQAFVGDLAETTALIWPARASNRERPGPREILDTLTATRRADLVEVIEPWLDTMDATERWVFLKLAARRLGVGVTPKLLRRALAELGDVPVAEIEEIWHGLAPPYASLFAWLDGQAARPVPRKGPGFFAMMRERPLDPTVAANLDLDRFVVEWRWEGTRVLISRGDGACRIFTINGDEISGEHPEVLEACRFEGVLDAMLVPARTGSRVLVRLLDVLFHGSEDLRVLPLEDRRARLETLAGGMEADVVRLSERLPVVDSAAFEELHGLCREQGARGLILKRRDGRYAPGVSEEDWLFRARDPLEADLVLMYMHHQGGGRAVVGAEATFGAWREAPDGAALVPVGKAVLEAELDPDGLLDKWVRDHTTKRFGPVTEVTPGLVMTLSFDAVERASRRKSGLILRGARVTGFRWQAPAGATSRLEVLAAMIA